MQKRAAQDGSAMKNTRERLQQERLRTVAGIVKADLDERFAGKIPFDPIVVAPATSVYGDDYFRIFVVVPDGSVLDPGKLNHASVSIQDKLWELDMPEFPNLRYIDESDWLDPEGYDRGRRGVYLGG